MAERKPNEISAGGVVAFRATDGWEICLIQAHGRWEIPKGHPNNGESQEEAAIREVSEETGLPTENLRLLRPLTPSNYVFQAKGRLIVKRVDTFLIICDGATTLTPQLSEVEDARWFAVDEARSAAAFKDTKKLIDEALEILNSDAISH